MRPREIERRWSLRTKVFASIVFSFLVVMPVIGLSLFYLNRILEDVINITQIDTPIMEAARAARARLEAAADTEAALALFRESIYLEQNRQLMAELRQLSLPGLEHLEAPDLGFEQVAELAARYNVTMNHLDDLYLSPAGAPRPLKEFKRVLDLLQDRLEYLDQEAEQDPRLRRRFHREMRNAMLHTPDMIKQVIQEQEPGLGELLEELSRIRGDIDTRLGAIQSHAEEHIKAHRHDVAARSNWARRNILTTIVITGIAGIYLVLFLPDRVVRNLRRMTHVVQQAERGDLDVATLEIGSDEVGDLANHLNRFMKQVRTFDALKTERMLQAERRIDAISENMEEGVLLVDDEMQPVYASQRARELLGTVPDGADDARITRVLSEKEFTAIVRDTLNDQEGQANRSFSLDIGEQGQRRLLISTDLVGKENGEAREILVLIQELS